MTPEELDVIRKAVANDTSLDEDEVTKRLIVIKWLVTEIERLQAEVDTWKRALGAAEKEQRRSNAKIYELQAALSEATKRADSANSGQPAGSD